MMLYREFNKDPSALYSIIIVNLAMCLFGVWVSYNDILLCTLWSLLFIFSSLNQGHVLSNTITRIGDISCAIAIFVLYCIIYRNKLNIWHILSTIVAVTFFLIIHIYIDRLLLYQYVAAINVWHIWVIAQVWNLKSTI